MFVESAKPQTRRTTGEHRPSGERSGEVERHVVAGRRSQGEAGGSGARTWCQERRGQQTDSSCRR